MECYGKSDLVGYRIEEGSQSCHARSCKHWVDKPALLSVLFPYGEPISYVGETSKWSQITIN